MIIHGQRVDAGLFIGSTSGEKELSFQGFDSPALLVDPDSDRIVSGTQEGSIDIQYNRGLGRLVGPDDNVATGENDVAFRRLQANLERDIRLGLVDGFQGVDIADPSIGQLLRKRAGRSQQTDGHVRAGPDKNADENGQQDQQHGVDFQSGGHLQLLTLVDAVVRRVTNQSFGTTDLGHDHVAGVDAGGAVHAFHLGPVADVNAGGTDGNAQVAIDAVSNSVPPAKVVGQLL